MNPLESNFKETEEFIPLTQQIGVTYDEVECPNVNYNMVDTFFTSEGDIEYTPLAEIKSYEK